MTPEEITQTLTQQFGANVENPDIGAWQVETPDFRLLVLLSEDRSWLRMLIPIVPAVEAQPFLAQLLAANFDLTQETRYALYQEVLWGVFQHDRDRLAPEDFSAAIDRLLSLKERGISVYFNDLIDSRIRQIVLASKLQGQTLESTLQTLERFYEEGMMGNLEDSSQSREATLAAWRDRLERLWPEVEP